MIVKPFVVLCCLAVVVLAADKYTDKYDNIDIKEILENKRLLTGYVNCMMNRGKCHAGTKELKKNFADALETGCEKCSEVQVEKATIVIDHLIQHELAIWKELCGKYDPDGKWRKKYEEEAKKKGIVIPED